MPAPSVLPGRAYQTTARNSNLLFSWRAADLSLTALTGQAAVFTRASDAGYTLKRGARHWKDAGYERRAGIGGADEQPSWDWVLNGSSVYVPALSLSGAFTNLVTSDDFDGGWDSDGTPVVTTGVSDPLYGTGAYTIADDDAGAVEAKYLAVTFTGDGTKGVVFVVKEATMASSGTQGLLLSDVTAPATRLRLTISAWAGGGPTVTAANGTYLGKRYVGNGYWAIFGAAPGVVAANTNRLRIRPAETAAATGSIDVWRVNAYNSAAPCPEILSASGARVADVPYWTFNAKPAAMSVYTKFVDRGTTQLSSARILQIGLTGATTDPRVVISAESGFYVGRHDNGATDSTATLAAAPTMWQEVELLLTLSNAGLPTLYQSINGATVTSAAGSAAAFASAWAGTRLYLGCDPAGGNGGVPDFRSVKVARGVKSMAEIRGAF